MQRLIWNEADVDGIPTHTLSWAGGGRLGYVTVLDDGHLARQGAWAPAAPGAAPYGPAEAERRFEELEDAMDWVAGAAQQWLDDAVGEQCQQPAGAADQARPGDPATEPAEGRRYVTLNGRYVHLWPDGSPNTACSSVPSYGLPLRARAERDGDRYGLRDGGHRLVSAANLHLYTACRRCFGPPA